MVFIVFLALSLVIACEHVDCTDGVLKNKINSRPNGFDSASANYRDDYRCGAGFPAPNGDDAICPCECCSEWNWCGTSDLHCVCDNCYDYRSLCQTLPILPPGLDRLVCDFEVDECGFNNAFVNIYAASGWLRICDKEGCSMRIDAGDSTNTQAACTLVSPSFSGHSGVLSMRYYIPDNTNAKNASLGVYIRRSDRRDRELIYLASSDMDRPWIPMAADRPWIPMSVDVHMHHTSHFKFEIDGFMENSKENIFVDDFEFEQKDHPHD